MRMRRMAHLANRPTLALIRTGLRFAGHLFERSPSVLVSEQFPRAWRCYLAQSC